MTFDPNQHMTNLKGKEYLEVKWRLVWAHEDCPELGIATDLIATEPVIIMKATIYKAGSAVATGFGTAPMKGNGSWSGREIEKAETAAIGRALAHAGYGTQFAPDDDEGDNLSDSPVQRKPTQPTPTPQQTQPPNPFKPMATQAPEPKWTDTEAKAFAKNVDAVHHLTSAQLLKALGVTRLGEWEKGVKEATAKVEAWVKQQ